MQPQPPHMSHTRLNQWQQCRQAYKLKYIAHAPTQRADCLDLGIVVHRALELLVGQAKAQGVAQITHEAAASSLRAAWATETVAGREAFAAADAMLRRFVDDEAALDLGRVLAVEVPFTVDAGACQLAGVMDRIDQVDDETIEIIDYKTSVLLPTDDDLASNLQLALYQHAAKTLWPWAKHVRLTLHMVRHGIKLHTTRTPEQIADALRYINATAQQVATAATTGEYAPTLSAACGTCLYRLSCPAYCGLLGSPQDIDQAAPRDLDAVATQRERMSALSKAADARKHELDAILRDALHSQGEVLAGGRRYYIRNTTRRTYPVAETVARLASVSEDSVMALVEQLATINNGKLDAHIKHLAKAMPKPDAHMLRLELDAAARSSYVPQIWSKTA